MDSGQIVALIAVIVVVVAVAAFSVHLRRHDHPEDTATHDMRQASELRDPTPMPPYPGTDRPGDPGAEGMAVPSPGSIAPGPEPHIDRSGRREL
jgi:hypothetical protein